MKDEAGYPEYFARFYDLIYAKIRQGVDDQNYMRKILAAGGPALEIGVGTGRLFIEALKRGVDIYGLDNSASMLSILKSKIAAEDHRRQKIAPVRCF